MRPKIHILIGALLSIIFYYAFSLTNLQAITIFLSSVFIDFDHYLYYVFTKKDLSLKKAVNWFIRLEQLWLRLDEQKRKKIKYPLILFHGIEFWFLIFILAQFYAIFYFVLLGFLIHMVLDFIELHQKKYPPLVKLSQLYVFKTNKKRKQMI